MEQREVGMDYQKWVSKLMGFDFEIRFRLGSTNTAADALSRRRHEQECNNLVASSSISMEVVQREVKADRSLTQIIDNLKVEKGHYPGYTFEKELLLYKGRLVIPSNSSLIPKVLLEYHNSAVGGHNGDLKTYLRLATDWYWVGMRKQVAQYVRECGVCQQQKGSHQHPAGLLQALPIPLQVWDEITMDFVEGLPKLGGLILFW